MQQVKNKAIKTIIDFDDNLTEKEKKLIIRDIDEMIRSPNIYKDLDIKNEIRELYNISLYNLAYFKLKKVICNFK